VSTAILSREGSTAFPTDDEIGATMRLAKALVESGFLPRSVDTPAKAVALMLAGREMGMGPMAALRAISIIDGKPVIAADRQLALFKRAGGRAEFSKLDENEAVLHLTHPNGDEHTESYAVQDAHRAGLTGKDNWKRHPKAMLRSRCITAGLKSVGFEPMADVYDPDEVTPDVPPPSGTDPQPSTAKGMAGLAARVAGRIAPASPAAPAAPIPELVAPEAPAKDEAPPAAGDPQIGPDLMLIAIRRCLKALDDPTLRDDKRESYKDALSDMQDKDATAEQVNNLAEMIENAPRKKA
jgi:hypothetical protein